jgi:small subunit ribosomal protein S3
VGQKVHPKGLRLGIVKDWDTKWYANKQNFSALLIEDVKIRKFVKKALYNSGVSRIEIERAANRVKVTVHTAKPGMVIGKQGAGIGDLQKQLEAMTGKSVNVNVVEVRNPELDAQLVAENIAQQLEKRINFRRAVKQAIQKAMRLGAKGIRVIVSGRIGGAEIARKEPMKEGTVPLHTLRANIDYGFAEANTTYGKIGVKCWIYADGPATAPAQKGERRERGGERGRGGRRGGRGQGGRAGIAAGPKPVNKEGGRS